MISGNSHEGVMDIHGYLNGLFDQINGINGIWRFNTYWWDGSVTNGEFITNMDNGTWIRYLIGYKWIFKGVSMDYHTSYWYWLDSLG
jgi:hypothetical protein